MEIRAVLQAQGMEGMVGIDLVGMQGETGGERGMMVAALSAVQGITGLGIVIRKER